jgi:hypothetical protein
MREVVLGFLVQQQGGKMFLFRIPLLPSLTSLKFRDLSQTSSLQNSG